MNNDEIEQALRDHYQNHELPGSRVDAILQFCEPSRQISRWKRLTFAGFGTASVAVALLAAVLMNQPGELPVPVPAPVPTVDSPVTIADLQQPERFQLIAVKIHADPCGRCKKIAPVFADLQNKFSDEPVLFLTFDLTSKGSRQQAEFLSRTFGIQEVFDKHHYTGVIVLATPDGQVREVVDSSSDLAMARKVVSRNLSSG
jgi:thiol-disulfide isomerase/thioredoxin